MTALTVGARVVPADLGMPALPGAWSVWSKAGETPGAWFLVPIGEPARAIPGPAGPAPAVKYAVVKAVMGASAAKPRLELIRTEPARADLEKADLERRNADKQRRHA